MDVLTRMKIEERLEFLPQTGKEEACICFPYLEDGVMKNMKFRDAAKHFKMVKGAELIPWNIDAIKGKEKCYITEGEIDALSLIAAGLEEEPEARTFSGWTASWSRTSMTRRKSSWPWIPTSAEWSCATNWCAAWAYSGARWWPGGKAARMPTSIC